MVWCGIAYQLDKGRQSVASCRVAFFRKRPCEWPRFEPSSKCGTWASLGGSVVTEYLESGQSVITSIALVVGSLLRCVYHETLAQMLGTIVVSS
eukprot:6410800-Amphidinium_carterae.1